MLERAALTLGSAGASVDHDARPDFSLERVTDTFFALLQAAICDADTLSGISAVAPGALKGEAANMEGPQYLPAGDSSAVTLGQWGTNSDSLV